MKKIVALIIFLLISSCKTGLINEKLKIGNAIFEKKNNENWETKNIEFKGRGGKYPDVYYFDDGSEVLISDNNIYSLSKKPYFYVENKEFFESGFIKEKGKCFGRFDVGRKSTKIGIWYEFDEKGNLIKQTNEDRKFGKFGYNEVLKFLDKKGFINLHTGKNRENLNIDFYYTESSNLKIWKALIKIGERQTIASDPGEYSDTFFQKAKVFYIDGNSGEIILRKDLIKYKEVINGFEQIYPDLK